MKHNRCYSRMENYSFSLSPPLPSPPSLLAYFLLAHHAIGEIAWQAKRKSVRRLLPSLHLHIIFHWWVPQFRGKGACGLWEIFCMGLYSVYMYSIRGWLPKLHVTEQPRHQPPGYSAESCVIRLGAYFHSKMLCRIIINRSYDVLTSYENCRVLDQSKLFPSLLQHKTDLPLCDTLKHQWTECSY